MSKVAAAVKRFPERELEIHRRCARDPEFGAVCDDYADARAALRHWRAQEPGCARAEEYRQLVEELEAEILTLLDGPGDCRPRSDDI